MNRKRSRSHKRLMYRLLNALFLAVFAIIVIVITAKDAQSEQIAFTVADEPTSGGLQLVELVHRTEEIPTVPYEQPTTPETEPPLSRYSSIDLSEEDIDLLARIIWLEARGESFEGQQAVAEVVFNRMLSEYFPDTLHEVIYEKNQFTTARNVHNADPGSTQYMAIEAALNGPNILPLDVVFFSVAPQNDNIWGSIGNHVFCYPWFWDGANE